MRRIMLMLLVVLMAAMPALAEGVTFEVTPAVLRPGKVYDFTIKSSVSGTMNLVLTDMTGHTVYDVYIDYPVQTGETTVHWNGLRTDGTVIAAGEYMLYLQVESLTAEAPLRLGAPYPLLTSLRQSDDRLDAQPIAVGFDASEAGLVEVALRSEADGTQQPLDSLFVGAGTNVYQWDGTINGARVPDGTYALVLTLVAESGMESMSHRVLLEVGAATQVAAQPQETEVPDIAQEDAAAAPATVSPSYSTVDDGSFWAMTPGETDDQAIWDVLMQPITVYDGGLDQKDHVYLMENPDGTGNRVAQAHGQSQGLHVIGEVNEHGYVLVETFSSYDDVYYPKTDEEKAHAFDLKQGYVKASGLKTVQVEADKALVIDKLTQQLHIYIDGKRAGSLDVSTGLIQDGKYYRETPPGEFITVSHVGPFSTHKYMKSEMAIRISGGILIHEVPYEPLGDGSRRYTNFEALLGSKASAGCIRVQRKASAEGFNQQWIWENLKRGAPYKVIIWDDAGRVDTP